MSGAMALGGFMSLMGDIISADQANRAQKKATDAQLQATEMAVGVERDRLAEQQRQYDEQMLEYRRKQKMFEQQHAQVQSLLAPYMQAGQGALYEMLALTGVAAPAGAIQPTGEMPTAPRRTYTSYGQPYQQQPQQAPQPVVQPWTGLRTVSPGTGLPSNLPEYAGGLGGKIYKSDLPIREKYTAPTTPTEPGRIGISSGGGQPQQIAATGDDFYSQAIAEFQKGGRSLSSKAWQTTTPDASPRAAAAHALAKARAAMPNATAQEQHDAAKADLQAQGEQEYINANMLPTIESQVNPYTGMTGAEAQASALDRIANSPILAELTRQGEQAMLQNAAATGGLRGGNIQGALAQYRPQMLQNEIDKQYARLAKISGLGQSSILGAPMTNTMAMPSYSGTSQIPQLYSDLGENMAGAAIARGQTQADMWGNIGSSIGTIAQNWGNNNQQQGNTVYNSTYREV